MKKKILCGMDYAVGRQVQVFQVVKNREFQ